MAFGFRHQDVAAVPAGWKVRTVETGSHLVRVAFPRGARKKGSGKVVSVLHPKLERNCNPKGLHLSACVDPDFVERNQNPLLESLLAGAAAGAAAVLAGRFFEKKAAASNPTAMSYMQAAHKSAKGGNYIRTKKLISKALKRFKTKGTMNGRKRNDESAAAQAFKDFHGRPATSVSESAEILMRSGDYAAIGDDPEIWLKEVSGDPKTWGRASIWFDPEDNVKLVVDPADGQLYFVGRQAMDMDELSAGGFDTSKRFVMLGKVYGLSYTTEKSFDDFDTITYAHKMGEETGVQPHLVYDRDTELLLLVGGEYSIAPVDGELGASPGIVN